MSAKRGLVLMVVLLSASFVVVVGCGGKKQSTMDAAVEQNGDGNPRPVTAEGRAEQLAQSVDAFASARKALQGHADDASRKQLAEAFARLGDLLSQLKGSEQDGAFRQQIRIIDRARTQLTSDSATAPEPTVNAAVRAAQRALSDMASENFADDEQTKTLMDAVRPRVDELSGIRGPIHGFETARALDAMGAVVQRMAEVITQRLPQPAPATAPAESPAPAETPAAPANPQ
jgi:hypothetical protein